MEQIRNKSVSTSEVLMKMADLYKQTGDDIQMANLGVSIFGNSFTSLIPMLKQGRTAIEAIGNEAGILSKDEINAAALAKSQIERTKKTAQNTAVDIAGWFAEQFNLIQQKIAFSPIGAFGSDIEKSDTIAAKAYFGRFSGPGDTLSTFASSEREKLVKSINEALNTSYGIGGDIKLGERSKRNIIEGASNKINIINGLIELANRENAKKTNMPGFRSEQLAWATSLQAMGGGDVLSAMAQNPQDRIAENTAQAVEVLQQIDLKTGQLIPKASPSLEPGVTSPSIP
jgi:hypothetical protein